ncbi:MAG: NTP transferase domain-containing protein [Desulfobacterales bacterium]|nr:NTP transferase domain-containing protein [Desulfobacterales bacterium]
MEDVAAIILAAGQGTRMKSDQAKVLHEIAGAPMIRYVVEAALAVVDTIVVVIGHQAEAVRKGLAPYPLLRFAVQKEQLGTGHAVMTAIPEVPESIKDVAILCGDTPFIRPQTIRTLIDHHKAGKGYLTLVATRLEEPLGYGRIVSGANGDVVRIVEESDASPSQKQITTVNTGTYCMNIDFLKRSLPGLNNDNAKGEFYLTDVVERAYLKGCPASLVRVRDTVEVLGVNTSEELAKAETFVQQRIRGGSRKFS